MDNRKEHDAQSEECVKELERKIDGELTLEDLRKVVGGNGGGPIYNGKSYSPLKSRFGIL